MLTPFSIANDMSLLGMADPGDVILVNYFHKGEAQSIRGRVNTVARTPYGVNVMIEPENGAGSYAFVDVATTSSFDHYVRPYNTSETLKGVTYRGWQHVNA